MVHLDKTGVTVHGWKPGSLEHRAFMLSMMKHVEACRGATLHFQFSILQTEPDEV